MRQRLEDGEYGALRVGHDGPAAHAFHGGGTIEDIGAQGFGFGGEPSQSDARKYSSQCGGTPAAGPRAECLQ